MAQLVGKNCTRCGRRIGMEIDAVFCEDCGAPVHRACAAATPDDPEACAACGTPADRIPAEGPPFPTDLAEPGQVRLWGAFLLGGGILLAIIGQGWVKGGIPVPWWGAVSAAVGVWCLLFPYNRALRERIGQAEARGWERPRSTARPKADAAPVACEGTFERPMFTIHKRLFPLTGRGRFAVAAGGIEVTGFRVEQSARSLVLLAVITFVVLGALLLASALGYALWVVVGGSALALSLWGASRSKSVFPGMRASDGDPVSYRIPWPAVARFQVHEKTGRIFVEIERTKPRGDIVFTPEGDAAAVLRALRRGAPSGR